VSTPQTPGAPAEGVPANLAEWPVRAVGFLIDYGAWLILAIITWFTPLRYLFGGFLGAAYLAWLGYLDGVTGQSPGKAMQGIRVVDQEGNLLGAGLGVGRKFLHILDWIVCGLGFFLPLVDAKKQTIADKVVNTYVVTGASKKPFAFDLWLPPKADGGGTTPPPPPIPPTDAPPATPPPATPPPADPGPADQPGPGDAGAGDGGGSAG
jgi:uncharacterized RDD family membrane protein YckC